MNKMKFVGLIVLMLIASIFGAAGPAAADDTKFIKINIFDTDTSAAINADEINLYDDNTNVMTNQREDAESAFFGITKYGIYRAEVIDNAYESAIPLYIEVNEWSPTTLERNIYLKEKPNTAPTVFVTSPNGGETLSGSRTIAWTATDANTWQTLTMTIQYGVNGGLWSTLATGEANDGAYVWDTTKIADGNNYLIKVIANDGKTTAQDTSNAVFAIDNIIDETQPPRPPAVTGDVYVRDVDVNPDEEVKPGQEVIFEIKLKSNIQAEYVTLEASINNIDDGDDLTQEIELGDLDSGDKVTEEVSMVIPYDADKGKYDVTIKVTWETDAGESYSLWEKADLIEVEREKHDVAITAVQLNAPTVEAGDEAEIGISLANIGENSEKVKIEVKSTELGVNDFSSEFELKKGKETVQYIPFIVPKDAKDGKYFIYTTAHYNSGKSEALDFVILEISDSGAAAQESTAAVSLSPVTVSTQTSVEPAGDSTVVGAVIVAILVLAAICAIVGKTYLTENAENVAKITKRK